MHEYNIHLLGKLRMGKAERISRSSNYLEPSPIEPNRPFGIKVYITNQERKSAIRPRANVMDSPT